MKKLSYWAKQNPRSARLFIALGRIFMAFVGVSYGLLLASTDQFWIIPLAVCISGMYMLAFIFYPRFKPVKALAESEVPTTFRCRKTCHALLVYSSFLAYVLLGNWLAQPPAQVFIASQTPVACSSLEHPAASWSTTETSRQALKKARKELRHAIREIRAARKYIDPAAVAGLTFFSVLLVIGGGILIAMFSCRLACNGQEGAATMVIVLGIVGIGLLLALLWNAASRESRQKADALPDK